MHMNSNTEPITLKSASDFRSYGQALDHVIETVKELKPGKYRIENHQKHYFLTLEEMKVMQERTNIGIRVIGAFNSGVVEIFDFKERQNELDQVHLNLNL